MEENNNTRVGYKILLVALSSLSLILIIFSFFAPKLLVQKAKSLDLVFTDTGNIGDTIGGLMNPFIALAGVMVTFLAFYIQYKFNEFQITEFRNEIKRSQIKYDKDKFENQFYEMLRLHRDNVTELYIKIRKREDGKVVEETLYGRRVFESLVIELSLSYLVALYSFKGEKPKQLLNEAYNLFFIGLDERDLNRHPFFDNAKKLKDFITNFEYEEFDKELHSNVKLADDNFVSKKIDFPIFHGYSHQLAHYYRHLFQTVKFVVKQKEEFITYSEKRNYLRILRAQLSNSEQALLFYNWFSDFGKQWEDDNNKFFTDYRMIHNIYNELLITQLKLEDIFDLNGNYRKEENRKKDPLFEFQDW